MQHVEYDHGIDVAEGCMPDIALRYPAFLAERAARTLHVGLHQFQADDGLRAGGRGPPRHPNSRAMEALCRLQPRDQQTLAATQIQNA